MDTTADLWTAFLAALIWVVHPVQSAAVIYVSGRADPLAATFGFLGLVLSLRFGVRGEIGNGPLGLGRAFVFLPAR